MLVLERSSLPSGRLDRMGRSLASGQGKAVKKTQYTVLEALRTESAQVASL